MKRILVATDGSEGADRAIRFAADLAAAEGADLFILNVIGGYGLPGGILKGLRKTESRWFEELLASNSGKILQGARHLAEDSGGRPPILESRHGDAVVATLDYARERQVDAVVVGKRGDGQLKGLLLGSVSQKLVSLAEMPVIVVP
jgi:nucleotide-binding universal stress UspA family protein